jgi:hypothetical protein
MTLLITLERREFKQQLPAKKQETQQQTTLNAL